ncbi:MAG: hypothetical protein VXY77_03905 [Pseudomonadota bacterium]|nr:hypothetical protein [Pseudomonadota bacterium]
MKKTVNRISKPQHDVVHRKLVKLIGPEPAELSKRLCMGTTHKVDIHMEWSAMAINMAESKKWPSREALEPYPDSCFLLMVSIIYRSKELREHPSLMSMAQQQLVQRFEQSNYQVLLDVAGDELVLHWLVFWLDYTNAINKAFIDDLMAGKLGCFKTISCAKAAYKGIDHGNSVYAKVLKLSQTHWRCGAEEDDKAVKQLTDQVCKNIKQAIHKGKLSNIGSTICLQGYLRHDPGWVSLCLEADVVSIQDFFAQNHRGESAASYALMIKDTQSLLTMVQHRRAEQMLKVYSSQKSFFDQWLSQRTAIPTQLILVFVLEIIAYLSTNQVKKLYVHFCQQVLLTNGNLKLEMILNSILKTLCQHMTGDKALSDNWCAKYPMIKREIAKQNQIRTIVRSPLTVVDQQDALNKLALQADSIPHRLVTTHWHAMGGVWLKNLKMRACIMGHDFKHLVTSLVRDMVSHDGVKDPLFELAGILYSESLMSASNSLVHTIQLCVETNRLSADILKQLYYDSIERGLNNIMIQTYGADKIEQLLAFLVDHLCNRPEQSLILNLIQGLVTYFNQYPSEVVIHRKLISLMTHIAYCRGQDLGHIKGLNTFMGSLLFVRGKQSHSILEEILNTQTQQRIRFEHEQMLVCMAASLRETEQDMMLLKTKMEHQRTINNDYDTSVLLANESLAQLTQECEGLKKKLSGQRQQVEEQKKRVEKIQKELVDTKCHSNKQKDCIQLHNEENKALKEECEKLRELNKQKQGVIEHLCQSKAGLDEQIGTQANQIVNLKSQLQDLEQQMHDLSVKHSQWVQDYRYRCLEKSLLLKMLNIQRQSGAVHKHEMTRMHQQVDLLQKQAEQLEIKIKDSEDENNQLMKQNTKHIKLKKSLSHQLACIPQRVKEEFTGHGNSMFDVSHNVCQVNVSKYPMG